MAIAHVQSTQSTTDAATLTVSYASTPASGNLLVAVATTRPSPTGGGVPTMVVASGGNNWTAGASGATDNHIIQFYYRVAGASEATAVTATPTLAGKSSFVIALSIWEFSGIASPELDKSNSGSSTVSVSSIASGTTGVLSVADEVVVSGGTIRQSSGTLTDDASLTSQDSIIADTPSSGRFLHRAGYKIVSATTAQNVTWSGATASAGAVIATFRAAPAGGATVPAAVSDLAGTAGNTQVPLTWTAPADGGAAITDYIVQYREVASSVETLLFSDEFNGTDNTAFLPRTGYLASPNDGWTFFNPNANNTGIIYTSLDSHLYRSLAGDGATGDWSIRVPIKANTNLGNLIFGYVDNSNFMLWAQVTNEDKAKLYKKVAGVFTLLGEVTHDFVPTEQWNTFRVDRIGNDLRCYLNDVLQLTHSMSAAEISAMGDGYGIWAEGVANYESLSLFGL